MEASVRITPGTGCTGCVYDEICARTPLETNSQAQRSYCVERLPGEGARCSVAPISRQAFEAAQKRTGFAQLPMEPRH